MADDTVNITHEEARQYEACLLEHYGISADAARSLIDDARAYGGLDRLLREIASVDGVEAIHRTQDPDPERAEELRGEA